MAVEIRCRYTTGTFVATVKGHKQTASNTVSALQAAEGLAKKLNLDPSLLVPQERALPTNLTIFSHPGTAELFYLQDSRSTTGTRAMFWREGGGYTSNLDEAEQFTSERAIKLNSTRETDLPWPVAYVRERKEIGVDCQYLSHSEAQAYRNDDGRFYVAYARDWDGNDIVWVGGSGPTANLGDAIHPGGADATDYRKRGFELWPCGYIVERGRPVVRNALLDQRQAQDAGGIVTPQRKVLYTIGYSCIDCGIDLSAGFANCPNCGRSFAP